MREAGQGLLGKGLPGSPQAAEKQGLDWANTRRVGWAKVSGLEDRGLCFSLCPKLHLPGSHPEAWGRSRLPASRWKC